MQSFTFAIPDDLAAQLAQAVPTDLQSEVVADALRKALALRRTHQDADAELIASCDALNSDVDIADLEHDMDSLTGDGLDEYPWDASASR